MTDLTQICLELIACLWPASANSQGSAGRYQAKLLASEVSKRGGGERELTAALNEYYNSPKGRFFPRPADLAEFLPSIRGQWRPKKHWGILFKNRSDERELSDLWQKAEYAKVGELLLAVAKHGGDDTEIAYAEKMLNWCMLKQELLEARREKWDKGDLGKYMKRYVPEPAATFEPPEMEDDDIPF